MSYRALVALALLAVCAALAVPGAAQEGEGGRRIVVAVTGLRNDRGMVVGGLYARPDRWLQENAAFADCHAAIRNGQATCVFSGVPSGPVAFAGMHDEDGDGAFDRDFLGLPSEGYAFSNDAREPLGPPSFEAASFAAPSVTVHVRYGI